MGKKSPPTNQTSTSTTRTEIDPALRGQLVGNFNIANLLTSGMLPTAKPSTATSSLDGVNGYGPISIGPDGQFSFASMPTSGDTSGLITNPDPSAFLNPDGSAFKAPTSFTAGFDPAQLEAQRLALQFANSGIDMTQSNAIAQRMMDFNPAAMQAATTGAAGIGQVSPMVGGRVGPVSPMVGARMGDVGQMTAASIAPTADVGSNSFAGTNLTPYQNAYSSQVVDPIRAYYNEQGDRAISQAVGAGRMGGAVRGSNEALISSLIRGEMAQAGGREIGSALKDQFGVTSGLVQSDLDRELRAKLANQQTGLTTNLNQAQLSQDASRTNIATALQRATTQAGMDQQTAGTNYEGALRSALQQATLDQQTGSTNYEGALRTALQQGTFDQQALLQNAQFGQQAALTNYEGLFRSPLIQGAGADRLQNNQMLGRNITQDQIDLMSRVGAERRGFTQAQLEDPWKALQMRQAMVSGAMPAFSSQTMTGNAPSPYARSGGVAGALGGAAGMAGLAGMLGPQGMNLMSTGAMAGPVGWGMLGLGALAGMLG